MEKNIKKVLVIIGIGILVNEAFKLGRALGNIEGILKVNKMMREEFPQRDRRSEWRRDHR